MSETKHKMTSVYSIFSFLNRCFLNVLRPWSCGVPSVAAPLFVCRWVSGGGLLDTPQTLLDWSSYSHDCYQDHSYPSSVRVIFVHWKVRNVNNRHCYYPQHFLVVKDLEPNEHLSISVFLLPFHSLSCSPHTDGPPHKADGVERLAWRLQTTSRNK